MTQYNSLNVKVLNSQLNKLKSAIKNESEAVLRLSSNMIGNSGDETNFPDKLLLTNRQLSNLRKAFASHSSMNIKLSKSSLLKTGLPLIKNVIQPLAKSVLIALELIAAASAADTGTHKKMLGSGRRHSSSSALHNNATTLIISNNEMEDIIKIVKSLEDSALLLKGVTETIHNEVKEQKEKLLSMLLGTLAASLLGNILPCRGIYRAGKGIVRASYGNKKGQKNNILDF